MDARNRDSYEAVIGLEIHVQLKTTSKIFSGDPVSFGEASNTQVSVVSLGLPGTLPRLNRAVVELGLRMAVACQGTVSLLQHFDRKNYFYPDLPKGYQLTQDRSPLCRGGVLAVPTKEGVRHIALEKIHMEEDAGKLIHEGSDTSSRIDFNRAGVPLLEVVTRPVIGSASEAAAVVAEVRKLVRYLEISDGNMEEGSLRCDANVSIRLKGSQSLGTKVEIKNLNSTRNLSHALAFEIDRQIDSLDAGKPVLSETRGFDVQTGKTFSQRTKEELNDYRYFPDPDLLAIEVTDEWLNDVRRSLPVLPEEWFDRLVQQCALSPSDALTVSETREGVEYFQRLCEHGVRPKTAANWLIGPVKSFLNQRDWDMREWPVEPARLAELAGLVEANKVSFGAAAQRVLPALIDEPAKEAAELAAELGVMQDTDLEGLESLVAEVIREFPLKVEAFRKGKSGIVSMFMGEVMKRSGGKADPRKANELIVKKLAEE
jgi:aspartyl-tRNA(Asn)/glutamyl-tRNA(Gln) amidotransferase subunit B